MGIIVLNIKKAKWRLAGQCGVRKMTIDGPEEFQIGSQEQERKRGRQKQRWRDDTASSREYNMDKDKHMTEENGEHNRRGLRGPSTASNSKMTFLEKQEQR